MSQDTPVYLECKPATVRLLQVAGTVRWRQFNIEQYQCWSLIQIQFGSPTNKSFTDRPGFLAGTVTVMLVITV